MIASSVPMVSSGQSSSSINRSGPVNQDSDPLSINSGETPAQVRQLNGAAMREPGDMNWEKAGRVVGKHACYGVSGFMPFLAMAGATAAAKVYEFTTGYMEHHDEEQYHALSSFLEAAGDTVKVGAALTAVGVLLAYPLGRFVLAPAAQKSYEQLMPDDMKEVVDFVSDQVPVVAQKGMDVISDVTGTALKTAKQAPHTVPAALAKAGMALGSLTQGGADAVTEVTQKEMAQDARYQLAQIKQETRTQLQEPRMEEAKTKTPIKPMQKFRRAVLAQRFINRAKASKRAEF